MSISLAEKARQLSIIRGAHLSEKASWLADKQNQFVFKVLVNASKVEIKQAVEQVFAVDVVAVRVLNVKGKTRRFKQKLGKRKDWKKAYVRLRSGQDIDFSAIK